MSAARQPAPGTIVVPDLLQGTWTSVVILTYGANLAFFESRLMSQLAQVPLRLILSDGARLDATFLDAANTGQRLRMANRAYLAAPIRHPRAAHAKLIMLLGPREGLLLVGSGNLSQDGYATPGELWHVFAYDDDRPEHVDEFARARSLIDGLREQGALDPPTVDILDTVWNEAAWLPPDTAAATRLRHNLDTALVEQLASEVSWSVEKLTTYAPFHDPDCAALAELVRRFRPRKLHVLVSRDTSVDPAGLRRVLSRHDDSTLSLAEVAADAATYVHAKWIHLVGRTKEALLTGSPNLSRSALINPAATGNIEVGVLSEGQRGAFAMLYDPLILTTVGTLSSLGLKYEPPHEAPESSTPKLLWSRLDGTTLTLAFDRTIEEEGLALALHGRLGDLGITHVDVQGDVIAVGLDSASAAVLFDGGPVSVRLGEDEPPADTWPYHLGLIRSRLHRAGQRDLLPLTASLPAKDAELMAILRQLEETLLIDPVSLWKVVKGSPPTLPSDEEVEASSIRWEDLDWDRIRRDPRYMAYHYRRSGPGVSPTDIQVVLTAISGRLGELRSVSSDRSLSVDVANGDDLAQEGDTEVTAEDDVDDDAFDDELTRRHLPISTRTRMAFTRLVGRYAAAIQDRAFVETLGPIVAVHNAAIFNHLLTQLLARDLVDKVKGITAQVALLEFLWGTNHLPGLVSTLGGEERVTADQVLADANVRPQTLSALARLVGIAMSSDLRRKVRSLVQHLILDETFGLDPPTLLKGEPNRQQARAAIDSLHRLAASLSLREVADFVVHPLGVAGSDAEWQVHELPRGGLSARSIRRPEQVLVLGRKIDGLTHAVARSAVERLAVAAYLGDLPIDYFRIRFQANGRDVAFWDAQCQQGITWIDGDDQEISTFNPPWPAWLFRLEELAAQDGRRTSA